MQVEHLLLASALAAALAAHGTSARAQEIEIERPADPALGMGLAIAGLGAAAAVSGGITMGTASDEACGLSGCYPVRDHHQWNAGLLLLGAGVGVMSVGALTAIGSATAPLRAHHARAGQGRMIAGIVLTSLAAGAAGIGNASIATVGGEYEMYPLLTGFIGSGVLLGIGIPLLATGARTFSGDDRKARERAARVPREFFSQSLMWTGGALIVSGAALGIAGIAIATSSDCQELGCLGAGLLGLTLGVPGAAMHVTGAVLLGVGSVRVPSEADVDVNVGPGEVALRWTFE